MALSHMTIEKCPAYAVITIDKRGHIRQLAAPDYNAARQLARQYEAAKISLVIEDKAGRVLYSREFY